MVVNIVYLRVYGKGEVCTHMWMYAMARDLATCISMLCL